MGTTSIPAYGVPKSSVSDIKTFNYNDLNSLEKVFKKNKNQVACLIMQPVESSKALPDEGFLEGVKRITHENEAVLIFDEIRTGFRVAMGGALEYYNVIPDMACFSKAMANGYPISVVLGKKEVMAPSEKTRISGTFFPNTFPMVAALATIKELEDRDGINYMWKQGKIIVKEFGRMAKDYNIEAQMVGLPVIPMLKFCSSNDEKNEKFKKIFFSELIKRGIFLHPNHHWFLSLAHSNKDIEITLNAADFAFKVIRKKLHNNT
jgi:glutamate-1-semialdehyde aminotransferase